MTLATAISKSYWVTWIRLSLSANMPAYVHTAFVSAPEAPVIFYAIFLRSIPLIRFIFLEWILRISTLDSTVGLGNSIFRSIRPGRNKAGSKISILLVAMMILMVCVVSKPSSWFNNYNIVRWTSESPLCPSIREPPIESTSSMKMMQGECWRAITNNSLTILAPSPIYFWTSSEPETLMKVQSVWWAMALASKVLPVPGGPYRSTPFGWAIPRD